MSAFEELGAGLGSLSLGGLRNQNMISEDYTKHSHYIESQKFDDDDLMDIDSVEAVDDSMNLIEDHDLKHEGSSDSDCEAETNTSFLDILRPTSLGVKYALKPQKLLMPPPDTSESYPANEQQFAPDTNQPQIEDHDYEFDTSFSTSIGRTDGILAARHRLPSETKHFTDQTSPSLFAASPEPHFYPNSIGQAGQTPFQGPHSPSSLQIHHHHYYPQHVEDKLSVAKTHSIDQTKPKQSLVSFTNSSPNSADRMLVERDHRNSIQPWNNSMLYHHANYPSQLLPSPWDPRAVPAERTPYVLSSYLQLLVNILLSGYALHIVFVMVQSIRQDVTHKLQQEASNLLVEIAQCERAYNENNCSPELIVPALEKMCAHWEKCMQQDPAQSGNRSSVSAHTIGVILNSLIEPLSFKVFAVGAMAILVIFSCNFVFGYIRAKTYYGWASAGLQRA